MSFGCNFAPKKSYKIKMDHLYTWHIQIMLYTKFKNLILSNSMNWLHILAVIHDLISLLFTLRAQHRVQVLLLQTGMSCYYKELKNTKNVIMISQIDHKYLWMQPNIIVFSIILTKCNLACDYLIWFWKTVF